MEIEVRKRSKQNMIAGFANKVILFVLSFVLRSVVNYTLGAMYLGLNSLFSSIIQVLMLSELGLNSALVYNMYKPVAENDQAKINALLNLYRNAYRVIGCFIFGGGVVLIPFLPKLIKGAYPEDISIVLVYLLQLLSTSISYLLYGYKQSLLVVYQREDVNSFINLIVQAGLCGTQIAVLLATHNYYIFVVCPLFFTVINNIWIGFITFRMFPNARCSGKLDKGTLSDLKKLVAGTFIQKACGITRNTLDSICISYFLGLRLTAIYGNYFAILSGVTVFLGVISTALAGGIGNHVVIKSVSDNFDELKKLDFLYMSIACFCTSCLLCLYQPFMRVWMGEGSMLPMSSVILLCLYFYLLKVGDMKTIYSSANGLWWKMRYRSVLETVANIVLNLILGRLYGVNGIILATVISLFVCNILWASTITFKWYFNKRGMLKEYFLYHLLYFFVLVFVGGVTYYVTSFIKAGDIYLNLVFRALACVVLSLSLLLVLNVRSNIFKESIILVKGNLLIRK